MFSSECVTVKWTDAVGFYVLHWPPWLLWSSLPRVVGTVITTINHNHDRQYSIVYSTELNNGNGRNKHQQCKQALRIQALEQAIAQSVSHRTNPCFGWNDNQTSRRTLNLPRSQPLLREIATLSTRCYRAVQRGLIWQISLNNCPNY